MSKVRVMWTAGVQGGNGWCTFAYFIFTPHTHPSKIISGGILVINERMAEWLITTSEWH